MPQHSKFPAKLKSQHWKNQPSEKGQIQRNAGVHWVHMCKLQLIWDRLRAALTLEN